MKGQVCWVFEVVCRVLLRLLSYVSICLNYVQLCNLATFWPNRGDFPLAETFTIFCKKKIKLSF